MPAGGAGYGISQRRKAAALRGALLRGTSAFALATALASAPAPAVAQTAAVLRAVAGVGNAATAASVAQNPSLAQQANPNTPMDSATLRALDYQAHANDAARLAQQAQAAARAAAEALHSSVPDGLAEGGLQIVSDPTSADQDSNGLHTWQGANLPTQKKSNGQVDVTIEQTSQRAILSWQTFNVGKNTTLTFDQSKGGKQQHDWVALNRVVGQLDPNTGLRDPHDTPAPSEILGKINAPGMVLILNQNGVIFGGTAQINVHSLVATSLEIGQALDDNLDPLTIKQRNANFLNFGLLGYADQASVDDKLSAYTFSAQAIDDSDFDPKIEGAITVEAGAQITSNNGGMILLTGPKVVNSGELTATQGQVSLQSGREIFLTRSDGTADSADPNVRGLIVTSVNRDDTKGNYVENTSTGLIRSDRGYISLGATQEGAVIEQGVVQATTSVSRNGFIQITGGDIQIAPDGTLAIAPDTNKETIPQDPQSIADFKPSTIEIGDSDSRIDIGKNALIYAPGGNITIGAGSGASSNTDKQNPGGSRIFIDTGAIIDAGGMKNVLIPASRNSIKIKPVTLNELRDTPNYKNSFLNGATVYVDPRLSGVRSDGVAWVGSPLIDAASYYQQVGVSAAELLTKGGNVTLGVSSYSQHGKIAPDVIVKQGATIDISGGYVTYQGGYVQTTNLVDASGHIVNISQANPNDRFIGIANGYTVVQPRWGVTQSWASPLLNGEYYEGSYTEGRDAGSLTIKSSVVALDGAVYAQAFAGPKQLADAVTGTATSSVYGDDRALQGAPSQLPSGGMLNIQALGTDANNAQNYTGGGDIDVVSQPDYTSLPASFGYGQTISIDKSGQLIDPDRPDSSLLPTARQDTIELSDQALSGMGLGELSLQTSGKVDVAAGANVNLSPGAVFNVLAGRTITVDGNVDAAGGTINMQTVNVGFGSLFTKEAAQLGSFDIVVNGDLSTRGRWVNDYGLTETDSQGAGYINGGSINLTVAPRVTLDPQTATLADTQSGKAPKVNVDISGSILLNKGSILDVAGGGYVASDGTVETTAKGGNLSLIDQTTYFQLTGDVTKVPGAIEGLRVTTITDAFGTHVVPVNPSKINARVSLDGTILANGFAGGGTFTLTTPQIQFGNHTASTGTELPLNFFSSAGFANYDITSYKTALLANKFNNGLGGYNALLQTQVLTVGAGQTLSLTQSIFSPVLSASQTGDLRDLQTGGDLYSVLTPEVPGDAWDRRAANLSLNGLIELHVAKGGEIDGDAGATLSVSQLYNEGTIRLVGGTIRQSEVLPSLYIGNGSLGIQKLGDAFSINADGTIDESAPNAAGITSGGTVLSNAALAAKDAIYLTGDLAPGQGVVLAKNSVTDLSGASIRNPRAAAQGVGNFNRLVTGRVVAGGMLETLPEKQLDGTLFQTPFGISVYGSENPVADIAPDDLDAAAGSAINLSGASDRFDEPNSSGTFVPTRVWSDGGMLSLGNGGTLTGAVIQAQGGAPDALGGTLEILDPVLTQHDPSNPVRDEVSADQIENSGFATFVADGSITSSGNVKLKLDRGFFLQSRPYSGIVDLGNAKTRDTLAPIISADGRLEIDAPYIALDSNLQNVSTPAYGTPGANSVVFRAADIDVRGAVLFDQSVSNVQLDATGDVRLIGVEPWQLTYGVGDQTVPNSLVGQLAVNGDLTIKAGQVYPTTGSTFYVTSASADGRIAFERAGKTPPPTPYSAGGNLLVQAAEIDQGGVVRVPIGTLTLGSSTPFNIGSGTTAVQFAPATKRLRVTKGSVTSVSAEGLDIPYGTTTDQTEWFFTPTGSDQLTAPPAAILHLGGRNVALAKGATVDIKGGGDLYAYEFISGTGGSHDLLDRYNDDEFSSDDGYQYPDQRQVYAIVPGLSNSDVAAYDPIYSSDYNDLYSASAAGQRVYLEGAPGLAAGWYTLLPAKYALLPGGMRVVMDNSVGTAVPDRSTKLDDGTLIVPGYLGTAGADTSESTLMTFDVQAQSVFRAFSNIAQTFANATFRALALHNDEITPQLPVDAGRLIINPAASLVIDTAIETTPGDGGRGAETDITGKSFDIVSELPASQQAGTIYLTADGLSNLNASSLLIGGVRTENADGTTTLDVTSRSIIVNNDAKHPLAGPEIILAVDGKNSTITLANGATIKATGSLEESGGDYVIDGSTSGVTGKGALLRVSSGPQRLVDRTNEKKRTVATALSVGTAELDGNAVMLDSTGNLHIAGNSGIDAQNIALGASQVSFARKNQASGLTITPKLQAEFAKAQQLTILTPQSVAFASGSYTFGNLELDSAGISLLSGHSVSIDADNLSLSNDFQDAGACGSGSAPACGSARLSITANEVIFGSGTIRTYGFGSVAMAADKGMFAEGVGTLDTGHAPLTLKTPFLGDQAVPVAVGQNAVIPQLTISTSGQLNIVGPKKSFNANSIAGIPGAGLALNGHTVRITNTVVRATAGTLQITATGDIDVAGDAVIETPSYSKTFGDSADPVTVSAPGGMLSLVAVNGDINLGTDTLLSVGGKNGKAGTLALSAANGTVTFDGKLDGQAPDSGGSLLIDTGGSFDLTDLTTLAGEGFTGNLDIHTGKGSLTLDSDQTIRAANVQLTADGGAVDIAGTIDVSGTNGGDVGLFGSGGVTLEKTAHIDAHAKGYARTDTRQAKGGTVEIETDSNGRISVDKGAVIDVSADGVGQRLVPIERNGTTYYTYVPASVGGTVLFRAPVSGPSGSETVNVDYAGTIKGASSIAVEGFKRFDLADIATDPNFVGVTINAHGQAVLDVGAAPGAGQVNFLADNGSGTIVDFVQNFDISGSYGNLGGLASQGNFHAQPGIELDYSGDIILNSNWNLGAGVVNVAGAVAAHLMAPLKANPSKYYVLPGDEEKVFQRFTTMTYRTGGSPQGEPGILTIRAGGTLDLKGSISDGFFQFGDQTDPDYLNIALGGGNQRYSPWMSAGCLGDCSQVGNWKNGDLPDSFLIVNIPFALQGILDNPAPYSAAANAPDALGSLTGGTGDPLGSAELFPLLKTAKGETRVVGSWSYRLVGGADLQGGTGGNPSVDPMRTAPGASGDVIVEGEQSYSYSATPGNSRFNNDLLLQVGSQFVPVKQWLKATLAANPSLTENSYTLVQFDFVPFSVASYLSQQSKTFFAAYPGQYQFSGPASNPTGVKTTLKLAALFMEDVVAKHFNKIKGAYTPPQPDTATGTTTATTRTLVRTGTGSIEVAAAGNIDLRNGDAPVYRNANGKTVSAKKGLQVGGTAIYTAGARADLSTIKFDDGLSGKTYVLDDQPYVYNSDLLAYGLTNGYMYGAGDSPSEIGVGYTGILVTDPVYADNGGDISLKAGGDVLGRRDAWQQGRLADFYDFTYSYGYSWIGNSDQPWRVGGVGDVTNIQINPQLFQSGVGTLGGGNISIDAGGNVSDLTVAAASSVVTADVKSSRSGIARTQALWTVGGGNVSIVAASDILGGTVDVASGTGFISAGHDISSAGVITTTFDHLTDANDLRLRLSDATIEVDAGQDITLQGIAALGVFQSRQSDENNLNARGFYSQDAGVSILADGSVSILNQGTDMIASQEISTDYTSSAVYPGSFSAAALTGGLALNTAPDTFNTADAILLYPSPVGELQLYAAGDIQPATLAMEDADPGVLPGAFSSFQSNDTQGVVTGTSFIFPGVLPDTSEVALDMMHNENITHKGDEIPNRIYAGGDILDMILSVPKQTRIGAGQDIINMMFFGQNVSPSDITRITAGRDILATTTLERPLVSLPGTFGNPLSTLQGNTFVIGGPGSFFLEAGRDAGPFLNSATTDGYATSGTNIVPTGTLTYGGGILSVGNEWDPWLPEKGSSLYVEFGVGNGANYDGFRNYYLDPSNFSKLPDYLFEQVKDSAGNMTADRNKPIYAPVLIKWMQQHASGKLVKAYGTTKVSYSQAYKIFAALPELEQRIFLLDNVYFNELIQTSIPTGPSYKQFSRGYDAVDRLFPASLGYTKNNTGNGGNGAKKVVQTGNLDLRLATIQTARGGNIYILGPGGRVLGGSTVRTSEQAARRAYAGGALFAGGINDEPLTAAISSIPLGYEGILTLRGGSIDTFTDEDFLLNQSRLFTEAGGDIAMWSSNGDLNAGQGPKTAANFPPIAVRIDEDAYSQLDTAGAVSGAGIAAFESSPNQTPPDVYLIAPEGTVDAGSAGVRVAGNLFVAALSVANSTNFSVSGTSFGVPGSAAVDVGALTSASSTAAAAAQAAQAAAGASNTRNDESVITVEVLGYAGGQEDQCKDANGHPRPCTKQDQ